MQQPASRQLPGSPLPRPVLIAIGGIALVAMLVLLVYALLASSGNASPLTGPGRGGPGGFGGPPGGGQQAPGQFNGPPGVQPAPRGGPGTVPPGGQPNGGNTLPQQNTGIAALPGNPDVVGIAQSVSGGRITVQSQGGSLVLDLSPTTVVYRADGTRGSIDDVRRGANVAIVSSVGADRVLHAQAIALLR